MKKIISMLSLILLSCTQAQINSAWQAAQKACVVAETTDPVVTALIPAWGPDVETVVAIICAIPAVISDFEGMSVPQAQAKTAIRLVTMSNVPAAASKIVK